MPTISYPTAAIACFVAVPLLVLISGSFAAYGQTAPAAQTATLPSTSHDSVGTTSAFGGQAVTVHFTKRPAQVGDQVEQQLEVVLQLESTVREGGNLVEQNHSSLQRQQQRVIVAQEIDGERTTAAKVHFIASERATNGSTAETDPITGYSYHCRREGEELLVTYADGRLPSPKEHQLVSESMHALGQPNPLANFLAGRSITVGQKLDLPPRIGQQLLGGNGQMGQVDQFQLTLLRLLDRDQIAHFAVKLTASTNGATQMGMMLHGILEVEVATCHTRRLELNGPLLHTSSFGSYSHRRQTNVRGKLQLAMGAQYTTR